MQKNTITYEFNPEYPVILLTVNDEGNTAVKIEGTFHGKEPDTDLIFGQLFFSALNLIDKNPEALYKLADLIHEMGKEHETTD